MNFTLIRLPRITSTQDWVRGWAELGAREGLVVQALEQTAGRGRLKRTWQSPPGRGLYISVLLRPDVPATQAAQLTMIVSLAAIDACIAVAGVTPCPKWPNDLLLEGRKLAGVLTELESENGRLGFAIIGLGLNVNVDFSSSALAATAISLKEAAGHELSFDALRDAYLAALAERYRRFLAGESQHAAWAANLEPLGRRVRVKMPGPTELIGQTVGVHADGALLIRDDGGTLHTIWAGDVIPEP